MKCQTLLSAYCRYRVFETKICKLDEPKICKLDEPHTCLVNILPFTAFFANYVIIPEKKLG